jgi:hypothetical protein
VDRSAAGLVSRRPRGRGSQDDEEGKEADVDVLRLQHGDDNGAPTDEDLASLRRVADALPWSAFLVALVEMCERFTYYGLSGPFQNYISNGYNDPANPGALGEYGLVREDNSLTVQGLGQSSATALTNFFMAWSVCHAMAQ